MSQVIGLHEKAHAGKHMPEYRACLKINVINNPLLCTCYGNDIAMDSSNPRLTQARSLIAAINNFKN